jgi:GNAT superfamily N-acetyltransferase
MMAMAIQRLNEGVRATLTAHFLALSLKDRVLRFGIPLAPGVIAAYVDRIDFIRDAVFGVRDDRQELVGVAHLALDGDLAEVGLSVLPAHRGRGLGSALFERAMAHARNRRVPRLIMHFLWSNAPILRIARRFRMSIVGHAGDVNARLELPPASLASLAGELVTDTFALYDRTQQKWVAAWKRQRRAASS